MLMERLRELQNNSLVSEYSLHRTSSETEDSIIVCAEVSHVDCKRFMEIQRDEILLCVNCAENIKLSEQAVRSCCIIECHYPIV